MESAKIWFGNFAKVCDNLASSPFATAFAVGIVVVWGVLGPVFRYSDTWQLVMNTTSSIITFIMVFILNNAQRRNTLALQAKLDALIFSQEAADNRMIKLEEKTEFEVEELHKEVIPQADG